MATVLLVDDEPDIVLMLKMSFEDEGHDVVTARNGDEALERLAEGGIDVVVLDLMMPVADGWSVLEGKRLVGDDTPVIVVSAKSEPKDMRRVMELGAVDYIMKPFDLDQLLALATEAATRRPPSAPTS
jgi:two-component system response regulator SaeR